MIGRPGSAAWLLLHELRLQWRSSGRRSVVVLAIMGGIFWSMLHVTAWGVLQANIEPWLNAFTPLFGAGVWLAWSLMLAQAILMSVRALFDRGDLDLLLSSPLDVRTVFLVRGLGIALGCTAFPLFLATPFAHMGVFVGHPELLAVYPGLAAMGLLAAAVGMLATLTLVRWLGARRARTVAQVLGALTGAGLFLIAQANAWLGPAARRYTALWLIELAEPGRPLGPDSALWLPLRALLGQPLALCVVAAAGTGAFTAVVRLAHRRFLAGTQESVTDRSRRAPLAAGQLRFRAGMARNVLIKEWKLLWRDPNLIAQTLLQLLYLVPLLLVFMRNEPVLTMAVPAAVTLSLTLAGSLAWLTVAAEDAPELIGTAPVDLNHVRWLKVLAAVMPVWLLLSPLLVFLLTVDLRAAATLTLCLVAGTACAGVMHVWYPQRIDRRHLAQRARSNKVISLLEGLSGAAWGATAYCMLAAPWFTPLPVAVAMFGPGLAWSLGRPLREQNALA